MAKQAGLAEPAVALHAGGAKAQPVRRRKLDALRAVEACMKCVGFVVEGSTQKLCTTRLAQQYCLNATTVY